MKLFTTLSIALMAGILYVNSASACTCAPLDWNVEQSFKGASSVVLAIKEKAVDIDPALDDNNHPLSPFSYEVQTTLKVVSDFKSEGRKEIDVVTRKSGAACGRTFADNTVYLIFAYENEQGQLATSLCSSVGLNRGDARTAKVLKKLADLK